ncbi:hypothetical protein E4U56_007797 [Claviceps arundinis]|uniref:Uncharacterized protein n=1 Tax=Claviceps arundinis TaxID=1623583 RepID=A0A9P7SUT3_9HYPO|nr:hypothetical protein E4U56_007797 [Claviceps arundinis]
MNMTSGYTCHFLAAVNSHYKRRPFALLPLCFSYYQTILPFARANLPRVATTCDAIGLLGWSWDEQWKLRSSLHCGLDS